MSVTWIYGHMTTGLRAHLNTLLPGKRLARTLIFLRINEKNSLLRIVFKEKY